MANKKQQDPMEAVIKNIEKQLGNRGKPIIKRFGDIKREVVDAISFGVSDIDRASYCGGLPRGKMVEIFGHESSGKSLLTLFLIAQAQKSGLECVLLDIEQSFDPVWASQHGVDVNKLFYANDFHGGGEQALEYASSCCKSGSFGLVVIDSTAALIPIAELNGTLEDNAKVGAQALLMSRACRKIRPYCGATNTTCIFINQIRDKIGVMYGSPETTPGGKALKFYSDVRIRAQNKGKIKVRQFNGKDTIVGSISEVVFVKNKTAQPFGRAEFKIIYDSVSMNPVVMLCNEAKNQKVVRIYKGIYRLIPEVTGSKKAVETGATTFPELAKYLVDNDLVTRVLDLTIEKHEEDITASPIDDAILEMKDDPSLIVAPEVNNVKFEAKSLSDAKKEEFDDSELEEEEPEVPEE